MKKAVLTLTLLVAGAAFLFATAVAGDVDGKAIYSSKCSMCHGKDGVAKKLAKGSGNFNDAEWQKVNDLEGIVKVVAEGKGKMKAYKEKLSAEQIKAVSNYIKTMGPSAAVGGGN